MDPEAEIMLDKRWALWLAGVIDCEGCLSVSAVGDRPGNYAPTMQISMTTRGVVDKALEVVGAGSLAHVPSRNPVWAGTYRWNLYGRDAGLVAALITPYLLVKKRQAVLVSALAATLRRPGDPRDTTDQVRAYRTGIYRAMKTLNSRGGDAPDLDQVTYQALIGGPEAYAQHLSRN